MRISAPVTDYVQRSLLTTLGDLIVRGVAIPERLVAAAAGTYLQGKGAATKPAYEATMPPLTTQGDIIQQGAVNPERLAPIATGAVLTTRGVGTLLHYTNLFNLLTTNGDIWVRGAANPERLAAGALGTYLQGKGAATKPAYEQTLPPLTTQGDIISQGAAVPERLIAGLLDTYLKGQGAGAKPIYEKLSLIDTGIAIGNDVRSTAGVQIITGVGFKPSVVIFLACDVLTGLRNWSVGYDNLSARGCLCTYDDSVSQDTTIVDSLYVRRSAAANLVGHITSLQSDGFTITWTLMAACSLKFTYLALP